MAIKNFKKRKSTSKVSAMEKASKFHRAFNNACGLEDWLRGNMHNRIVFSFDIQNDLVIVKFEAFPRLSDDTCSAVDVYEGYSMRYNIEPKNAIDNLMKYLREKPVREKIIHSPEAIEM